MAKKFESLLDSEVRHTKALTAVQVQIDALITRVDRLETREDLLMERAKSAAGMGAMVAMSDLARRIGGLEACVQSHPTAALPTGPQAP